MNFAGATTQSCSALPIAWLDILGAVCKCFKWACLALCQMGKMLESKT